MNKLGLYSDDMREANIRKIIYIMITLGIVVMIYFSTLLLYDRINGFRSEQVENLVYLFGWIGISSYIYILITWKKVTGRVFTPYIIFCTFIFLFNYGQFIMWAIGIHYKGELGTTDFIRYMDDATLLKVELVSITGILSFHLGALISAFNSKSSKKVKKNIFIDDKFGYCYPMKVIGIILILICTPIVLFQGFQNLSVATKYGYTSIYYGGYIETNILMKYTNYFFLPGLLCYLIGNKISKKSFFEVSMIFGIYMVINLLAGDRGSWIYFLVILFWCYTTYISKISFSFIIKCIVIGSALLILTSVLVKFREIGFENITKSDFRDVLQNSSYVFIKPFFEMGQSARVLGIIIQDNLDKVWPYGNTYIAAILSMFLPRIKVLFGYPDFYLDNWISQQYLALNKYGVGFSITAEAYLNGGVVFSVVYMLMLGIFISKLIKCDRVDLNNPKKMFVVLASTITLIPIARGSTELFLRQWAYGVFILLIIINVLRRLLNNKQIKFN
ncbi:O-antigen polysaccharide polymerase Wzy family protein [Clostridium sardiniense]|uniref:O-antigen polysaccharide polymerase Wzy family protein n=1 Tax=Clostridium sardiniense TaxID=29369 RepID=A0ABS7KT52_CLOSR|nr:O-antigen polysaccharide polymerase Wzy [Clostridium sardiniense]MBY0753935.1 O-antigen polysaccharide polymerase Wzy family protein [Clostridium sardiniense]MDQ0459550.1 oligosaccharide repeat unit polymerase [Clostridium sardiniense]